MIDLVVGCPIRDRAWAMEGWFGHLFDSVWPNQPRLVFVGDPIADSETFSEIDRLCLQYSWSRDVVHVTEEPGEYQRLWNQGRYQRMVDIRNILLGYVRGLKPDLFWSVDSDIFLNSGAFSTALMALDRFDAVGSKCYMTDTGTHAPSFAMLNNGGLMRWEDTGCFPVDVIMAIKLMTPPAYAVDYSHHTQGEDIGWSINARSAGLKLGWDGTYASRHVMDKKFLIVTDERCPDV